MPLACDLPSSVRKNSYGVASATLHWVSAAHAVSAEVRLYDTLFPKRDAGEVDEGVEDADWKSNLNLKFLETRRDCRLEPCQKDALPGSRYQFERLGYFIVDAKDTAPEKLVFNRTVTLRDTWAKITKAGRESEENFGDRSFIQELSKLNLELSWSGEFRTCPQIIIFGLELSNFP